jgi:hypothetical protein
MHRPTYNLPGQTCRDRQNLPNLPGQAKLAGTGNASPDLPTYRDNLPGQAMHRPSVRCGLATLAGTGKASPDLQLAGTNLPGQAMHRPTYRDRLTGTGNASAERSLRSRDCPTGPSKSRRTVKMGILPPICQ